MKYNDLIKRLALFFGMALVSCHTKDNPASEMRVTLNVEEVGCCKVRISASANSPYTLDNSTLNVTITPLDKVSSMYEFLKLKTSKLYDDKMYVVTGFLYPNQEYIVTAQLIQDETCYEAESLSFKTADLPAGELLDMGVSVKWASCNIGASRPYEQGWRFAWAETAAKTTFSLDNYKWYSQDHYTKYNNEDGLTLLQPDDDAATVILGSGWRVPSRDEVVELAEHCDWMWVYYGGAYGLAATSPSTGNTLFFPAKKQDQSVVYGGWEDYYWTASRSHDSAEAVCIDSQNAFAGYGVSNDDSVFHRMSPINAGCKEVLRYESALIRPVSD